MTSSKRQDLQGLRGVAIGAVLLFHFFPQSFPNGYIGVDMFFVLSGFLISMILSKKDITFSTMHDFYYRRMKRILPLYLFLLLSIILFVFLLFPREHLPDNIESAWNALLLSTNIAAASPDKAYAAMLTEASDAFTHTWSLAVEMQFYVLVPILFCLMRALSTKVILTFVATTSIIYGLVVDENVAFNSVFTRLWQFQVGISANLITNYMTKETEKGDKEILLGEEYAREETPRDRSTEVFIQISLYLFLLIIISQALYTEVLPAFLLRTSSTILSGAIILFGSVSSISILTNRFVVYIGDVSYALYLVHWPVYLYVKEYHESNVNAIFGILFSLLLAILLSETFEKFYLRLGRAAVLFLIGALFLSNILLLLAMEQSSSYSNSIEGNGIKEDFQAQYRNLTKGDIMHLNSKWDANDQKQVRYEHCKYRTPSKGLPKGWCDLPVSPSSSNHSLMVMGNSWAANVISAVHKGCKEKVSSMTLYWYPCCEVLVDTKEPKFNCKGKTGEYLESIREQRPDTLMILVRHMDLMRSKLTGNGSITDDVTYKLARKRLAQIEPLVGKSIILLQSLPVPKGKIVRIINDHLKIGQNVTNAELDAHTPFEVGRRRISALVADCKKCRSLDYIPSLSNENGDFLFFDPPTLLSHFTVGLHLTPIAIDKVAPVFEEVCRNL